jgi:hypothetical protein
VSIRKVGHRKAGHTLQTYDQEQGQHVVSLLTTPALEAASELAGKYDYTIEEGPYSPEIRFPKNGTENGVTSIYVGGVCLAIQRKAGELARQ